MRGARYFCITTECIRYALAYFDPDYVASRSRDAVKMYIFGFLKCNRLTYRRITHRGCAIRSDMQDSFRTSVFLCASATGRKLRPMVVFAGVPGAFVHDELKTDKNYNWEKGYYTVHGKAYCDHRVMQDWIDEVWAPDIQKGQSVLLLDSLKTHKMESIQTRLVDHAHNSVVCVPPGVTGISQPMDMAVMKPFKDRLRYIYMKYVIASGIFTDAAQNEDLLLRQWSWRGRKSTKNPFRMFFLRQGSLRRDLATLMGYSQPQFPLAKELLKLLAKK
ncbi:hypothetical protein JG688_00003955 [Phytophthora aleatoria]|uniref:DDE-1 domain-containing protein n=1 Tax=Phytophthora aleatoria TaxID=2496075 RepID=A0A8J5ITR3_9STRA|nr:hypothetical protein JG688_00003955 [Phytophthora aleatoria]